MKIPGKLVSRLIFTSALLVIFSFTFTFDIQANPVALRWRLINSNAPARYDHKCSTDLLRSTVVLFGGKDSSGQMPADVWELPASNPGAWICIDATGPEGRAGHGMWHAFPDSGTILFGGINQAGQYLNDTWIWNGTSWTKIDSTGPSPRAYFGYTYDLNQRKVILFGGIGNDSVYGDTWEWDFANGWQRRTAIGPPPRFMSEMAYRLRYPASSCVLFGGQAAYDSTIYNDTWQWDGDAWSQLQITGDSPYARIGHAIGYNYEDVYLFGGQASNSLETVFRDTWQFDSPDAENEWQELFVFNPPRARSKAAMAYCTDAYATAFLVGGRDSLTIFNDTWAFPYYYYYLLGDVNDNGVFDGLDVIYCMNYFKGTGPPPPFQAEILPGQYLYAAGDVNGSCSFNGLDITYMVSFFKGGPTCHPCPNCPP